MHTLVALRGAALAALVLAAVTIGCSTPVGVERVDARTVHRELTANVLSAGRPSAPTLQVLHRLGLFERFEREPEAVLARLHEGLAPTADEDRVFALAELSFLHGEQSGEPTHFLASAVYAYAFLFPGEAGTPPGPFDPRFRVACELYNRGLTEGLASVDGDEVRLEAGRFDLPFGPLDIASTVPEFQWGGNRLAQFVPAADLKVRGLRNRYRHAGIGAPLAGAVSEPHTDEKPPPGHGRLPQRMRVPVTALLRLDAPRHALSRGVVSGTLELYSADDTLQVTIEGRRVPLEFETTSSLALGLEGAAIWGFELEGFRFGDRSAFRGELRDGLFLLHPYRTGRVPVVLVHGTASSPARWTELINELENDPRIWKRYQIWLFMYNTGNPVALSGGLLRKALLDTVAELDPRQRDPALQRMVVIGHSQGGLLTKLTAIDSGTRFWDNVTDVPLEQLEIKPETRELLERSLFFKPLPFVKRLVFIATPHQGSYLTAMRLAGLTPARWIAGLIELPGYLTGGISDLVTRNPDAKLLRAIDRLPTSIDNMTPGNPFLQTLAAIPVAPGVTAHSIIAVRGDGPPEEGSDGVVKYSSAHIEGVASELVVRSGHSTQAEPATIEEVRRILLEHAKAR
jgi:pimeloyl-ACP methyl ester carboxylesterase